MEYCFENKEHIFYQYGIFTTGVKVKGKLLFWSDHLQRLLKTSRDYFNLDNESEVLLTNRIENLITKIPDRDLKIKFSIYPVNTKITASCMKASDLSMAVFWQPLEPLPRAELKLKTQNSALAKNLLNCKLENYSEVFYWKRKALQEGFDDILFTNLNRELLRATTSNFFLVKDKQLIAPDFRSLHQLEGITIGHVHKCFSPYFEIVTREVDYDLMATVDGIFLTNSVAGIVHIQSVDQHQFQSKSLFNDLWDKWNNYIKKVNL